MVFSSLVFLFAYLPVVLLVYYLSPLRWRNVVLFAVSLLFYGWGEPVYILLMMVSVTSAYAFGFLIERCRDREPEKARRWMLVSVLINLSFLFFFKYYNFFASILRLPQIAGLSLPIGISFYTFQILSYTIDLWRGETAVQRNYIAFGTYVTLFPQLIAGPIVRYQEIDEQLSRRRETIEGFASGVRRFCCGLGKKVLLGDTLAAGYAYYQNLQLFEPTALGAWMIIILYTLHLYYDFSGYSDMAIGLGRMFGFSFPENFNYPYIAKSITEFWRRWHITLSTWFREYVYIPLGGNRRGKLKQCRNIAVVWALTGLWHGANWNFVLWGLYFCVILICEHLFLRRWLEKTPAVFRHFYTMLLVVVSFLIFSYTDLAAGLSCFRALFGVGTVGFSVPVAAYQLLRLLPLLAIAAVGSTPWPRLWFERWTARRRPARALVPVLSAMVLVVCVVYLVDSTFSPFEYLNF